MTRFAFFTILPAILSAVAIAGPFPGGDQSKPESRGMMMPQHDQGSDSSVIEWEQPGTHRHRPSIFIRPNTPRPAQQAENNSNFNNNSNLNNNNNNFNNNNKFGNNNNVNNNVNNGHRGMMRPKLDPKTGSNVITFGSDSDSSSSSSDEDEQAFIQIHGSAMNKKQWENVLREMEDDDDEDEIVKARQESSRIRAGIHGKRFDRNMGEKKW